MSPCIVAIVLRDIGNGDAEQLGVLIADVRSNPYSLARILHDAGHPIQVTELLRHRNRTCPCYTWA